jgi:hypothetical protein
MARQRRGGGFRPPELRGTLGTLLRTTLAQAGSLRDVLERGAREGRSRLDSALSNRRRSDALADLGEIVLDLIRRGEIDLGELPEVRDIVAHLDEIDAGVDHDEQHDEESTPPPSRNRFDARRSSSSLSSPSKSSRAARDDDDGTVSSRTWSRPSPAKPQPRVWRPPVDEDADTEPPPRPSRPTARPKAVDASDETQPGRPPHRRSADDLRTSRKDPTRKGGIHFDDDDDLDEYMHPDDVPPKTPPDSDS